MQDDPSRSTIFLIEKIWIDNLENRDSWGYSPTSFVYNLKEAEQIVASGGRCNKDECWAFEYQKEMPKKYRYKELPEMILCT